MRSLHTATKSSPHSQQLEKACAQQWRPNAAKDKYIYFLNALKKKKDREPECWWGWGETGTLKHCLRGCNKVQLPCLGTPQKVRHGATIRPSNSTPGHIHKRRENTTTPKICVCSSIILNRRITETIKMTTKLMDKQNVANLYTGISLSHTKEWSSDTG